MFAFEPAGMILCISCFQRRDTLAPVETIHADGYVSTTGAALCKACCLTLPLLHRSARLTWPDEITARDIETLWDMVRQEQIAQAPETAGAQQGKALLLGKTDTEIRREINEARETLRRLEKALDERARITAPVAAVLGIGGKQ